MVRIGAKHTSVPSMIWHHSSRVFVLKILASRSFIAGHCVRSICAGSFSPSRPGELHQLGVELRLDRADRDVLAVLRLVRLVEVGARVEQVGAALAPAAERVEAVDEGHQQRRTVDHRGVDHLALARRRALDQRRHDAEREQHAAAAEVADEVERRQRRLALAADVRERARERDVVDVVAGGLRHRAALAEARHAAVDEARILREADVGAEPEPLHHAGTEALGEHVRLLHAGAAARPRRPGA